MAEIAIRKAAKSYGKTRVLHGVDLEIANGEFIVILGPSGCGKSTLLRMIAGLEAIDAGEIALGGRVVNDLEPRERGCAMVFQNYALYPHMSVADNIGYALRVAGRPKAERMKRVAEMAAIVGLGDFLDRKPNELSGGQRQRVAMARAMIREPKVFLFDEPLSNLDAKLRVQMRLEIRRLHQRVGATSVFVTHDQIEAMALADRIVVMNAGRIEQIGTPRALYAEPATRFVANFIGSPAMNLLDGEILAPGRLRLDGGHELAYDPAMFGGNAGQKVEIGIRPEDIQIGGYGGNRFTVSVGFIEEMGPSQLAHCTFGALGLAVMLPAGAPERNEHLSVHFPATKFHLFDHESGERLRAPASALKGVIAA